MDRHSTRAYKWKMLAAAINRFEANRGEVTSHDFAQATGLAAHQTGPYSQRLLEDGYIRLTREVPPERGGRPQKFYVWTRKPMPSIAGEAMATDTMWGRADHLLHECFNRMVRCREVSDAGACAV